MDITEPWAVRLHSTTDLCTLTRIWLGPKTPSHVLPSFFRELNRLGVGGGEGRGESTAGGWPWTSQERTESPACPMSSTIPKVRI